MNNIDFCSIFEKAWISQNSELLNKETYSKRKGVKCKQLMSQMDSDKQSCSQIYGSEISSIERFYSISIVLISKIRYQNKPKVNSLFFLDKRDRVPPSALT